LSASIFSSIIRRRYPVDRRSQTMSHRRWRTSVLAVAVLAATATVVAAPTVASGGEDRPGRCVRAPVEGDTTVAVPFRGTTYPVLVHVPDRLPPGRVPLVLNLHGSGANGSIQMDLTGLRAVADDKGFIVAAPDGDIALPNPSAPSGSTWAWNVPGVPTTAGQLPAPTARNDVQFLSRVIDTVSARLCTDARRTYATGHSGGARMTSALACRLSEKIAAVAAGAGLRTGRPDPDDVSVPEIEDCRPTRAVPVVTWHGQQDVVNPYAGNGDLRWGYQVPVAVQSWARINGCRVGPRARAVSEHVTRFTYTRCRQGANVKFYRVSDGGHTWPGAQEPAASTAGPGLTSQEINASRILWDFFRRHPLPAGGRR
jgi:polyhydroxybutyrate depolymerase